MTESFQSQLPQSGSTAKHLAGGPADRRMVRADLLGAHSHQTTCGVQVHVWKRNGKYLARGYLDRKPFGETLGANCKEASIRLHRLLVEIEDGSFIRPSELRSRQLKRGPVARLTIRQLCDNFLVEKRKTKGKQTAKDYRSRLSPLIEFSELPETRRTWPLAMAIDRDFSIDFRNHLGSLRVTRNGRPGARNYLMSPRQAWNILDCVRSLIHWAKRPDINQLPSNLVNPFTEDIVGTKPKKDPLRSPKLPFDQRMKLVHMMDGWQLAHLAMSIVLSMRPEDCTGLLVSDIDFPNRLLKFHTRLGGRDFNKGHQQFVVPLPAELLPLLRTCIAGRKAGPVLRRRAVFQGHSQPKLTVCLPEEVSEQFELALNEATPDSVQTLQDQKALFRSLLRQMGGTSGNEMNKEFKKLIKQAGLPQETRFYDLRSAVSTEMHKAGLSHLTLRYITGHTTNDILNDYIPLDPVEEMPKYFQLVRPLLEMITTRAIELGIQD